MAEAGSNTILSEDEIEAALSEIESMPGGMDDIPSLDDDLSTDLSDNIAPVERKPRREQARKPAPAPPARAPAPAPVTPEDVSTLASETPPPTTALDDLEQPAVSSIEVAEAALDTEPEAAAAPAATTGDRLKWFVKLRAAAVTRVRRILKRKDKHADSAAARRDWREVLHTTGDKTLDLVNRPFQWMGDETRQMVGFIALITLTFSVIVMFAGPLLAPKHAAVEFIKQKRAELVMSQPKDAARVEQP